GSAREKCRKTIMNHKENTIEQPQPPVYVDESLGEAEKEKLYAQYGALSGSQLAAAAAVAPEYIVSDYIPPSSIGIMVGEWGVGKSPFVIQLLMTLAAGNQRFLDRYATPKDPINVLYVDYENGVYGVNSVIQRVARFIGLAEPPKTFRVYSPNY